jgi:molecular chaperone GrpE
MSSSLTRTIIQELLKKNARAVSSTATAQLRSYHQIANSMPISATRNTSNCLSAISSSRLSNQFVDFRSFSDKVTDEEKKEEEAAEEEAPIAEETEVSEVEKLKGELKQLKDQFLRSLAEQENIRRIAKRDVENARNFAVSSFAKSLLDTSDNLSRAMDAVPEEYRAESEGHPVLSNLYEGIQMTDDGLTKAFAKNGLKRFGITGDKFDPNMHEALFQYPDENMEDGSIGQVMKSGFTLNDRVIRPAEVGVIKKA